MSSNLAEHGAVPARRAGGIEVRRMTSTIQEFLARLVEGKTVLDVGCADHSALMETAGSWLHKHLARSARSILGLDILESEVGELRRRGYDVVSGDATTAPSRWGISLGGMAWRWRRVITSRAAVSSDGS